VTCGNSVHSHASLNSAVASKLKSLKSAKLLLADLESIVEREMYCATMNPNRVRNSDQKEMIIKIANMNQAQSSSSDSSDRQDQEGSYEQQNYQGSSALEEQKVPKMVKKDQECVRKSLRGQNSKVNDKASACKKRIEYEIQGNEHRKKKPVTHLKKAKKVRDNEDIKEPVSKILPKNRKTDEMGQYEIEFNSEDENINDEDDETIKSTIFIDNKPEILNYSSRSINP